MQICLWVDLFCFPYCLSPNAPRAEPQLFSLCIYLSPIGKWLMNSHLGKHTHTDGRWVPNSSNPQSELWCRTNGKTLSVPIPSTLHLVPLHVSATPRSQLSPIRVYLVWASLFQLLPVFSPLYIAVFVKCWKVTVKMWNCNFFKEGYNYIIAIATHQIFAPSR